MPTTDWSGVRDRVEALRGRPGHDRVFGASGHGFRLDPPLSVGDLRDLEAWLDVALPEDYRAFLAEVGAGGAGPFYGIFPVRRRAARDAYGAGWEWVGDGGEMTDAAHLAEPFRTARVPEHVLDALEAERPREPDFTDLDELDAALDRWDERVEALLYPPDATNGAICLSHEGCAYRDWLVVSGPARGHMWEDPRTIDRELRPMPSAEGDTITFGRWYLAWLADAESALTPAPSLSADVDAGPQ